ncbi:MAG: DUF3306 domain-containing protein [Proteobacteria bacterium]|nr:DUF3306 domain-containing protein [Pseudomonadota bacterium]
MIEADDRDARTGGDGDHPRFSLRRWSQRKHQAVREARATGERNPPRVEPELPSIETADAAPPIAAATAPASAPAATVTVTASATDTRAAAAAAELPPIDTLTIDSDFAPFMRAGVDPGIRREALKKLLRDPRFNVMDGLDVYIDDYTKTTPIEPSLARKLVERLHPRAPAAAEGAVAEAAQGSGAVSRAEAAPARAEAASPSAEAVASTAGPPAPAADGFPARNAAIGGRGATDEVPAPDARRET